MQRTIAMHLEGLREDHLPIPEPAVHASRAGRRLRRLAPSEPLAG
jgi:hypothetical protein